MAEENENVQNVRGRGKKKKTGKKGGKGMMIAGKIFLVLLILTAQVLLAYTIVDNSYEKMYSFVKSIGEQESVFYKMDELIVNPAGTNGQRYLVVEISLELSNDSHLERVRQQEQRIKHNMNEALSSRTVAQLVQFEEREKLRYELAGIVNAAVGERSVRNLYYTKYVMQ
jgi:flagellar basal body-associated protein FliL